MAFGVDETATTGSTLSSTHIVAGTASGRTRAMIGAVRAWRRLAQAFEAAGRWLAATVTPVGWLALGAAVLLLPAGLLLGWMEFAVAGLAGAVALVIALPFLAGGRSYDVSFQLPADRVVAGSSVTGTLRITNTARRIELPGRIDVPIGAGLTDVWVPLLRAGHSHEEPVRIPALRRGVIDVGPVTTVRTDPLGLLKREVSWADVQRLYVHPRTVAVPATSTGYVHDLEGAPTHEQVADDISFHSIREYASGDSRRHIHWKSTAKTGTLMVRQFEESRRSRLAIVLALSAAEYATDDEFELAVSAVGSLGVRAIRDGRDVAVVTSEHIIDVARGSVRAIRSLGVLSSRALLDDLSLVETSPQAMAVEDVCQLASRALPDVSIAVVVCGSVLEARRIRQLALRLPRGVRVVAIVADPGAEPAYRDLGDVGVFTVALLDDLRRLLARVGV